MQAGSGQALSFEENQIPNGNSSGANGWRRRGRTLERPNICPECGTHYSDTVKPEPKQPQSMYQCWKNMLVRCRNANLFAYCCCGARGITVCARWKQFENFAADMEKKPKGTILVRVNSDGNLGLAQRARAFVPSWSTASALAECPHLQFRGLKSDVPTRLEYGFNSLPLRLRPKAPN